MAKNHLEKVLILFLLVHILLSPALALAKDLEVPVLLYHHLVPGGPDDKLSGAIVPLEEFQAQMEALYHRGYYTPSLAELEAFVRGEGTLPEKSVVITFDDGYLSNYTLAYPLLEKYGFKAAIFPIGRLIPEEDPLDGGSGYRHFSFKQMQTMVASGLIEFGSHTFDAHKDFDQGQGLLGLKAWQVAQDLEKFQELFKKKNVPFSPYIAYPMGKYNDEIIDIGKKTGHRLGFTVNHGLVKAGDDPMTLNRIIVYPGTGVSRFLSAIRNTYTPLVQGFEDSIVLPLKGDLAYISGKPVLLGTQPLLERGRVMVPLRFVAQALGAQVHWSEDSIFIVKGPKELKLKVLPSGEIGPQVMVGSQLLTLDPAPIKVGSTVLVPTRFIAQALGAGVKWHPNAKMVQIWP